MHQQWPFGVISQGPVWLHCRRHLHRLFGSCCPILLGHRCADNQKLAALAFWATQYVVKVRTLEPSAKSTNQQTNIHRLVEIACRGVCAVEMQAEFAGQVAKCFVGFGHLTRRTHVLHANECNGWLCRPTSHSTPSKLDHQVLRQAKDTLS